MKDVLVIIKWGSFVAFIILQTKKCIKEMRCMKNRRKLLDEVCDYLHDVWAISAKKKDHADFISKFCERFGKDRFQLTDSD